MGGTEKLGDDVWGKECGAPNQGERAAGKAVLGMRGRGALPLGMSKKGGAPCKGKSAAEGGQEGGGRKDDKGGEVQQVWKEGREYGVDTGEC